MFVRRKNIEGFTLAREKARPAVAAVSQLTRRFIVTVIKIRRKDSVALACRRSQKEECEEEEDGDEEEECEELRWSSRARRRWWRTPSADRRQEGASQHIS